MGRRSKSTVARLNDLKKTANPKNPTVEGVFDEEDADFEDEDFLEHSFFFLDKEHPPEDESDASDDGEVDEDELTGLQNEAGIEHFNAVLAQAQEIAEKAECGAAGKKTKAQAILPQQFSLHQTTPSSKTPQARYDQPKNYQLDVH